jgi:uncharacterized repeat protein (TIGR02543 family)
MYAKFIDGDCRVSLDTAGGSYVPGEDVPSGSIPSRPEDPSRKCDVFAGWFSDAAYTTPYSFDEVVSGDTTIYAKWTEKPCLVDFETICEGTVESQAVAYYAFASVPAAPKCACNVFAGWFADASFTIPFDFNSPITSDTTIYAKWRERACPPRPPYFHRGQWGPYVVRVPRWPYWQRPWR